MRRKTFAMSLAALIMVAIIAVPAGADDGQTSLGEVAKQKPAAKAKRVITDDDMPSTSQQSSETHETQASSSGSDGKSNAEVSETSRKEPANGAKSAASADLDKELKDLTHDEDLLNKRLQQLQEKADRATDQFRKQMYTDSIANQQTTLQEFQKKRQELETQIAEQKSKKKS